MTAGKNLYYGRFFLALSVAALLFVLLTRLVNVYHFAFIGAIFEMLWLPVIAVLFVMPVLIFIYWWKTKFSLRSIHIYSLLVLIITILLMVFLKRPLL